MCMKHVENSDDGLVRSESGGGGGGTTKVLLQTWMRQ